MIILFAALVIESFLLLYSIKTKSVQPKTRSIVYLLACTAFVLFWISSKPTWDFRWYGFTLYLVILFFYSIWKLFKPDNLNSSLDIKKGIGKFLINITLIFVVILPILLFPISEPIPPSGSFRIETIKYTLVDQQREEIFTPQKDNRSVEVAFWVPKSQNKEDKFPLVIFSHGGLGTITSNESLYLELASHGFVVCSIGHPFHALSTVSEDGKIIRVDDQYFRELQEEDPGKDPQQSYQYYQKWMQLRTDDINFVLDTLINKADSRLIELYDYIDVERIGIVGHSLGGSAALAMPRLRDDIDMVVALESPYLFDIIGVEKGEFLWLNQDYPVPVLNIYSDSAWSNLSSWSQYRRNVEYLEKPIDSIENLYLPGAGHFSLTDLSLASPIFVRILEGGKPDIEYRDYLQQVNQAILEFANGHLKSD